MDGMVFLEDVLGQISPLAKAWMLAVAFLLPARVLSRLYANEGDGDSLATIVFSSGSTGVPKGVMLSHRNILANVDAIAQVFQLRDDDVMVGVLPLFHSFGFSVTLWLPMVNGFGAAFHPNPMDGKTIGELAETHRGTILVSTPTFYAGYVRKCRREQFAHVRYALVGAEKLREPIAAAFQEKFGIRSSKGTAARRWRRWSPSTRRTSATGTRISAGRGPGPWVIPFPASPRRWWTRRRARVR